MRTGVKLVTETAEHFEFAPDLLSDDFSRISTGEDF